MMTAFAMLSGQINSVNGNFVIGNYIMNSPQQIDILNTDDNPCVGKKEGVSFPYPADCNLYILCLANDLSVTVSCPVSAWYDPKSGNCGPNVSPTACRETEKPSTTSSTTPHPDELCVDQEQGVSYPFVPDCKKYIVCLGNGKGAIVNCIYNAWFDPITSNCGPDVSPTACMATETTESTQSTTTSAPTTSSSTLEPTTTRSPTTTTDLPISPDLCAGVINGKYVTYPDNCSKYIVCVEPIPIAFYCTPGYYFNEKLQVCIDWDQSDCPAMVTPEPTTPAPVPSICNNNTGATFPYPDNCKWFMQCINDDVYMMRICTNEDYYDPFLGVCSSSASPDACREDYATTSTSEETTISTTTSTTQSTTKSTTRTTTTITTTTSVPVGDSCEGVAEGKLVPYPYDCTKFIKCERPTPVIYDCVEGQEFSAKLERCMAPWFANCVAIEKTIYHWIF